MNDNRERGKQRKKKSWNEKIRLEKIGEKKDRQIDRRREKECMGER